MRPEVNERALESFDLQGLRALVTGGGSGLGRQMARALAEAGASVVVCGRRPEPLAETVTLLTEASPGDHQSITADITSDAGLEHLRAESGEIDVLVNNAGYSIRNPWTEVTPSEWREVMAINVESPFRLSQMFAPPMAERGFGRIINVASVYGVVAGDPSRYPGLGLDIASYFASKHALVGLTKYLAVMLGHDGVTVNALSPGMFPTDVNRKAMGEDVWQSLQRGTPIGRLGSDTDLKAAIVFLAGKGSSFVTGQNLIVDGGWTTW